MYRLIAFDLDQTLIGNDLTISPRVQQAVAQAIGRGVYVSIITGREAAITSRFARQLDLNAPIVCAQGGCIYDFRREQILHDERLPEEILPKVVQAAKDYGWNLSFELFDKMYLPSGSNHPQEFLDLLPDEHMTRVDDLLGDLPDLPRKLLVTLNDPADRQRILAEMRAALGEAIHIVPTHPYLVEGLPCGVDKGRGLAWLADYFHIPQAEVIAVGDNDNDIPMIEWAGMGVAMGHASPGALAVADWVAPDLEHDGAAVVIEKYILK
jgi:Cof subfamily protein (haloacid dehalogenase superfamily)